ncbi:unnamed protein product [Prorocentrum cordatum]|uniref:Alpha-amylase/branching enzyme C-terminal all beta domain-containing protein n=1 Tax=Prorocentrum cordatum TaxID=2364126 RepID=A0ABN9WI88_9DINO|nr:unnamed protein product [Polarella glacialis]
MANMLLPEGEGPAALVVVPLAAACTTRLNGLRHRFDFQRCGFLRSLSSRRVVSSTCISLLLLVRLLRLRSRRASDTLRVPDALVVSRCGSARGRAGELAPAHVCLAPATETSDDDWDMGPLNVTHSLQNRRWKEPCVAYTESHDQDCHRRRQDPGVLAHGRDAEMYTHMSTMSPPSMVVDRGLALHKMMRLVTMGLGGEGWLCFMGNEFGHPEWVDFPTEANGWSYQHCRRRFDLAGEDHLKYKFFEAFDVLMCALENRFKFLASDQQFCSKKDDQGDKVIVFERGDLLFVFNFHPCNSYTDYRIGHPWNEGLRVLLDSDEGRFGGHCRLEWGHTNSAPPGQAWDNRYHSTQLYIPSRTVQVLCRESLIQGGVTIRLAAVSPTDVWPFPKDRPAPPRRGRPGGQGGRRAEVRRRGQREVPGRFRGGLQGLPCHGGRQGGSADVRARAVQGVLPWRVHGRRPGQHDVPGRRGLRDARARRSRGPGLHGGPGRSPEDGRSSRRPAPPPTRCCRPPRWRPSRCRRPTICRR